MTLWCCRLVPIVPDLVHLVIRLVDSGIRTSLEGSARWRGGRISGSTGQPCKIRKTPKSVRMGTDSISRLSVRSLYIHTSGSRMLASRFHVRY